MSKIKEMIENLEFEKYGFIRDIEMEEEKKKIFYIKKTLSGLNINNL